MAKLALVGTGFLGASLGLALRPSRLFDTIAGYDLDRGRLRRARELGAIDEEAAGAAAAARHASVVVLTVPSSQLEPALESIVPGLFPEAVVTETTRWKVPAQRLAAEILGDCACFIPGRPVLDAAGHGPEEAGATAFENAVYCLTPSPTASQAAIDTLSAIVTAAGAQPYFLEPAEHDVLTAAGELLPPALLACLALTLTRDPAWRDAGKLAGPSLNRLAILAEEVGPVFWQEAADNSAALAGWLDAAAATLVDLRDQIQSTPAAHLATEWEAALKSLGRWRNDKRQLRESTMPPRSELRPNLFGRLGRR